jgi:hypothetical protein
LKKDNTGENEVIEIRKTSERFIRNKKNKYVLFFSNRKKKQIFYGFD